MRENYKKNINYDIKKINDFLQSKTFLIEHTDEFPLNNCKIILSKLQENYCVDFNLELKNYHAPKEVTFKKLGFNKKFKVISDENRFVIPARSANKLVWKLFNSTKKLKGELKIIYSESFPIKSNSIFRSILKVQNNHLTTIFSGAGYSCNKSEYGLGLVEINVNNLMFHIYRHNLKKEDFLIIECLNQTNLKTFECISQLILKSIALLTGNWYQNETFILSYSSSKFEESDSIYFKSLRDSIITNKEIINPTEFKTFMKMTSMKQPLLAQILFPEKTLSKLIISLKEKPELERTVELLIEGNGIKSPLIKCSIFHVALETIVGLINSENKEHFKPIKSSKNIKPLKDELKAIILSKTKDFNDLELNSLIKKITYINTPSNKDKFLLAYTLYKIELPEELKRLLNNRNKFLHGKTPYNEGLLKTKMKDLNLEADRIHMLVSILILKYCGYRGHLKNQAANRLATEQFYENPELEINENMFYKI